jgi:hypothetical protein
MCVLAFLQTHTFCLAQQHARRAAPRSLVDDATAWLAHQLVSSDDAELLRDRRRQLVGHTQQRRVFVSS